MEFRHSMKNGKLHEVSGEDELFWIELINPTEEEIEKVIEEYNLPKDYIFDVKDPDEVPRVEGLKDNRPNLFILNYPVKITNLIYITRAVSLIVLDKIVITVRNENSKAFSNLKADGFHKIEESKNIENFLLEVAWRISRTYIEDVKNLNDEIVRLEEKIKKSRNSEALYDMIDIQRSMINFQIATKENGPVIESIFDLDNIFNSEFRKDLLHDLQVENKQAIIMIEKSTIILENLSDLYSNVISNNLNDVMKILTSITIVMTVPTIIGGLWGMNTKLPMERNPFAFWYLILLSFIISIVIIYYLKKKNYL